MTNQLLAELEAKDREIERLHSIIKEVREYMKTFKVSFSNFPNGVYDLRDFDVDKLLEILDKDSDKE